MVVNNCVYESLLVSPLQYAQAADVFDRLGDHKSLVILYVDTFQWDNVRQ